MAGPDTFAKLPHAVLCRRDLSPAAKVVYAILSDMANSTGKAWPGIRYLSELTGLATNTVIRARRELAENGAVKITNQGNGRSSLYEVQSASEPEAPQNLKRCRNGSASNMGGSASGSETEAPQVLRRIHNRLNNQTKNTSPKDFHWKADDLARIYSAYPRKVGRADALKAIDKALDQIAGRLEAPTDPVAWLVGKVEAFAKSKAGNNGVYTPHPTTWMNKGRYDDDPAEWTLGDKPGSRQSLSRVSTGGKYAGRGYHVPSGASAVPGAAGTPQS